VRLLWERRHRDGGRSDFRDGGVTGTVRGRTSVTIGSESFHTSARSATKMPGTSHSPAPGGPFRAGIEGSGTRCRLQGPYGGPKVDNAPVTVGQHGRKRGVPDISVTGSDSRHGSASLSSPVRGSLVTDAPRVLPLPAHPAVSSTATACQGRGRDGPSLIGRQLAGNRPFRAPARGPHPRHADDRNRRRRDPVCLVLPRLEHPRHSRGPGPRVEDRPPNERQPGASAGRGRGGPSRRSSPTPRWRCRARAAG